MIVDVHIAKKFLYLVPQLGVKLLNVVLSIEMLVLLRQGISIHDHRRILLLPFSILRVFLPEFDKKTH